MVGAVDEASDPDGVEAAALGVSELDAGSGVDGKGVAAEVGTLRASDCGSIGSGVGVDVGAFDEGLAIAGVGEVAVGMSGAVVRRGCAGDGGWADRTIRGVWATARGDRAELGDAALLVAGAAGEVEGACGPLD